MLQLDISHDNYILKEINMEIKCLFHVKMLNPRIKMLKGQPANMIKVKLYDSSNNYAELGHFTNR